MSPKTMVIEKRGGINFMESVSPVASNSSPLYPKSVFLIFVYSESVIMDTNLAQHNFHLEI